MSKKLAIILATLVIIGATVVCSVTGSSPTPEPDAAANESEATPIEEPTQLPVEEDIEVVTTPTPTPIPEPTAVSTPEPAPTEVVTALTAQEAYDQALAIAREWQPDAVLNEMGTTTVGPLDAAGTSTAWAIKFWSPGTQEINSMTNLTGEFSGTALPIGEARIVPDMDTIILDAGRIYDIAAGAGGDEYLAAGYVAMAGITPPGGGSEITRWIINYLHPQSFVVGYAVQMDARTGDVTLAIPVAGLQPVDKVEDTDTASDTIGGSTSPDPAAVLQAVFDAAKSGEFDTLQNLCDPQGENDGDTQGICDLATDETNRDSFVEFFEKGQINGAVVISADGSEAEVPFLFGPDGRSDETMKLINRDGQWYLSSF